MFTIIVCVCLFVFLLVFLEPIIELILTLLVMLVSLGFFAFLIAVFLVGLLCLSSGCVASSEFETTPEEDITLQYALERERVCTALRAVMPGSDTADCLQALEATPVMRCLSDELPCTDSPIACYRLADHTVYTSVLTADVVTHELVHAAMDAISDDPTAGVEHSFLFSKVLRASL